MLLSRAQEQVCDHSVQRHLGVPDLQCSKEKTTALTALPPLRDHENALISGEMPCAKQSELKCLLFAATMEKTAAYHLETLRPVGLLSLCCKG